MSIRLRLTAAAGLAALLAATASVAQAPGIKRVILQRTDMGNLEVVLGLAEIPPGVAAGRHTHPGVETGYILQGSASMEIEGETPKLVKAGDSYSIPAGKVHDAKTVGDQPVRVLATYVVEKGKPLASPAP